MATYETNVTVSDISARLAAHIASLAGMTEALGVTASTYVLKHLEPRIRQGLVRVAVVGITGSGKSTAVNSLVERLALPENPSVSTPIPVWLGYHDRQEITADIYCVEEGELVRNSCDIPTFRRKYCYNIDDILDKDRSRYNNVEFGAVRSDSPILRGNLALIDTLGISATSVDSRKTIRVLEEGVDAVIFVTKNSKLTLPEMQFLYQYVLCCRSRTNPEETELRSGGIRPENLIFVNNNFYGAPDTVEFSHRIRAFYRESGLGMAEAEIEACVGKNIFYINAFQARLSMLGAYPYVESAPEGSSEEAVEALAELEAGEKEELEFSDCAELLAASGIRKLSEAVREKGRELGCGENAVSVNRIRELITVIDGVIQTANTRITGKNLTITDLENKRELFRQLEQDDLTEQGKIKAAMNHFNDSYEKSFLKLLQAITPELKTDCAGKARRKIMPKSLKSQYDAYRKMDRKGKEAYLAALLPEEIKSTYEYCSQQMIRALDERQTDDFRTPFAVMEDVRSYIQEQETLFEARIQSLRSAGGEELGMFFPESMVVKELFSKLELDLTEKVKEIIADGCVVGGKKFEEQIMAKCIRHCSLNMFESVAGLIFQDAAPRWLWDKIKEKLFVPLAEFIVDDMPKYTLESIRDKTAEAFDATREEICRSHIELFVSLKITLSQLEKQITDAGADAAAVTLDMEKLKKACEEIKADILRMQYQLQNG